MLTPKEERNAGICDRYVAGETAEAIATDVGLSIPSLRVILREGGALNRERTKKLLTVEEKVISPLHAKIGSMVAHHRSFTKGIDRRMAAENIGWSMQRLAAVERGFYNLTLTDLQDAARFLEKPIEEIVREQRKTETPTGRQSQTEHAPSGGANLGVVPHPTYQDPPTQAAGAGVSDQPGWQQDLLGQRVA